MTVQEAREKYGNERGYVLCQKCPTHGKCNLDNCNGFEDAWKAIVDYVNHDIEATKTLCNSVNHPNHYNRENSMECIDEMVLVFGKEAVKNFCLCNIWKYRYRASDKNGEEDLKKSDWYMRKYKELCSNE